MHIYSNMVFTCCTGWGQTHSACCRVTPSGAYSQPHKTQQGYQKQILPYDFNLMEISSCCPRCSRVNMAAKIILLLSELPISQKTCDTDFSPGTISPSFSKWHKHFITSYYRASLLWLFFLTEACVRGWRSGTYLEDLSKLKEIKLIPQE